MKIVDLFSGAGGLTFGFYYRLVNGQFIRTDNQFIFANENDIHAANAYTQNYPEISMQACDIQTLTKSKIKKLIGDHKIDIIIGGPPCQSFSTIGQRKFDEKAKLYTQYLRMLKIIQPKMFLFENVKGMLSMREQISKLDENKQQVFADNGEPVTVPGRFIIDIINKQFNKIRGAQGYTIVGKKVLNAKDFGVPQNRERLFLIGVRNDLVGRIHWDFPNPTHGDNLADYLTISEAISDLPVLIEGGRESQYDRPPDNDYQILMRGNNEYLSHHFCGKHNDKMRQVIAAVIPGEGRPYINKLVEEGKLPPECKLTSGYNNTYGRLVADQPSPTITNNMCIPSALRCIHYEQNRELSPREGARIQSFPDWFIFDGARVDVTKQIGNAVPPILAMAMARKIEEALENL